MNGEKFAIFINASAGKVKKNKILDYIKSTINTNIDYTIFETNTIAAFETLFNDALTLTTYSCFVAVGGDGTVNAVGNKALLYNKKLAIIPLGSGNGLARTLGIPMDTKKALNYLLKNETLNIDVASINNKNFFCTSGIGFDALISFVFAQNKTRGLTTYIKLIIGNIFNYKSTSYTIEFNDKKIIEKSFLITIANASQWGNNIYIAPLASITDNILHATIIKKFGLRGSINVLYYLLKGNIHKSKYATTIAFETVYIHSDNDFYTHYDGEPYLKTKSVTIKLLPIKLKVLIPLK